MTLSAAAMAGPRALPPERLPAPFGVNIHFTEGRPGEVAMLAKAYKVARMDFMWHATEKERGRYDFSAYDSLVKELESAGVEPYFILDYGNDLYQAGPPRTPEAMDAYARWAAASVAHYKGHRIVWEFWNEPNGNGFWGGKANSREYAALVNAAGPAVRKADPAATLAVGALSGFDWEFVDTIARSGALRYADAFAVHPYRSGFPESVGPDYSRLRRIIDQFAGGRKIPILSGEWGYSTNRKTGVSEERQAQYLARQRLYNARCGVRTSIWYDWKEDGPDPDENEHHFGSVRPDLTTKPAYKAALTSAETLAGYEMARMLVDEPNAFVMLLRNSKGESALALWTTGPRRTFRVRGRVERIVSMLGRETPGDARTVQDIAYGPSPRYALLGRNAAMDAYAAWQWVRPGDLLAAGRALPTTFTLRNATGAFQTFTVALGVKGGTAWPARFAARLKPGEIRRIPVALTLWSRPVETRLSVTVDSAGSGLNLRDVASVPVSVSNPMTLSMDMTSPGSVHVAIEAPAARGATDREAFRVTVTKPGGAAAAPARSVIVSPSTQGRAEATFPVPAGKGGARAYGVSVTDARGHTLASLAPVEARPLYTFDDGVAGGPAKGLSIHEEGDPKVGGSAAMAMAADPGRGPVVDIQADFPDGWRYFVVTPDKTEIPANVNAVGMWVNGDGQGDFIRCRFVDAKGQTWQPTVAQKGTWKGWKWVTMRLDDTTAGSWGGPQDGVIHRPIRWDSIFLLDNASQHAHKAHIQIDDITLMSGGEQSSVRR
jgi:hypothetical protein